MMDVKCRCMAAAAATLPERLVQTSDHDLWLANRRGTDTHLVHPAASGHWGLSLKPMGEQERG
jgi:hypothetical protein